MPKSVISILMLFACMLLYWCSKLFLNNLKVFNRLEPEKRNKCQIYIFELLGIPIALSYLLYEGTFDVVFRPDRYTDMGPRDSLRLLRSMSSFTFLIYMYAIEIFTNKLRWSLNLHHASVIFTALWFMVLLDGSADLASIRCFLAISLHPFTESNVFIQLLAYRLYPSQSWPFHAISAALYTLTRLFVTITFIICYISWAITDEITDQLSGKNARDPVYFSFFFIVPVASILLNIAQIQTIKALCYMTKNVFDRQNAYGQLRKDLESIFAQYAVKDNAYWTIMEWMRFVSTNTSCQRRELSQTLFDILLFDADDRRILTLNAFKHIFEPHIVANITNTKDALDAASVKQIIIAKIETLFHVLSTSKHTHTVVLEIHQHIQSLIDTQRSVLDLPDEIEPIHVQVSRTHHVHELAVPEGDQGMKASMKEMAALSISIQKPPLSPFSITCADFADMNCQSSEEPSGVKSYKNSPFSANETHLLPPLNEDKEQMDPFPDLQSISVPQPSLPFWYNNNRTLSRDVSTLHREYTVQVEEHCVEEDETPISLTSQILFYGVTCPLVYGSLCALYVVFTETPFNMYHLVSLFATLSSAAFVLFYVRVLLFATNICYFEMTYRKINGINYIPDGMVMDEARSFDSMSMLSHVRGSTIHKHHVFYVNFGSFSVFMGALMKLFDLRDKSESSQQVIAVYMLMVAGIGGITHANIELYSSPSYSERYNLTKGYLHLFGVFLYSILGNLSFFLYSNMDVFSSITFGSTFLCFFVYYLISYLVYKKDSAEQTDDDYIKRTNKRSKINMGMELVTIVPAAISMCAVIFQFGQ